MRALTPEGSGDAWARAVYAFLAEKEKRRGQPPSPCNGDYPPGAMRSGSR